MSYLLTLSNLRATTSAMYEVDDKAILMALDNELTMYLYQALKLYCRMIHSERKTVLGLAIDQAVKTRKEKF